MLCVLLLDSRLFRKNRCWEISWKRGFLLHQSFFWQVSRALQVSGLIEHALNDFLRISEARLGVRQCTLAKHQIFPTQPLFTENPSLHPPIYSTTNYSYPINPQSTKSTPLSPRAKPKKRSLYYPNLAALPLRLDSVVVSKLHRHSANRPSRF